MGDESAIFRESHRYKIKVKSVNEQNFFKCPNTLGQMSAESQAIFSEPIKKFQDLMKDYPSLKSNRDVSHFVRAKSSWDRGRALFKPREWLEPMASIAGFDEDSEWFALRTVEGLPFLSRGPEAARARDKEYIEPLLMGLAHNDIIKIIIIEGYAEDRDDRFLTAALGAFRASALEAENQQLPAITRQTVIGIAITRLMSVIFYRVNIHRSLFDAIRAEVYVDRVVPTIVKKFIPESPSDDNDNLALFQWMLRLKGALPYIYHLERSAISNVVSETYVFHALEQGAVVEADSGDELEEEPIPGFRQFRDEKSGSGPKGA